MNKTIDEPHPEASSRLEQIGQLRARLTDLLLDAETLWKQSDEVTIAFRGHLNQDSEQAYTILRERFAEIGYTPMLRARDGYDVVIALRHVFEQKQTHWSVNLILFLLTLMTTTLMGAVLEQGERLVQNHRLFFQQPELLLTGLPAAMTIISILGVHELAHYVVARKHGLDSSLPFFIPVPLGLGTLGAIIRIHTPWENRKALFDVGIAGPLAGFVVALPIFIIGMFISPIEPVVPGTASLQAPLLLQWIEHWTESVRGIPPGYDTYLNTVTFAAWFGLIVTGVNLLPIGQLDGGHVIYALLGQWAQIVGIAVLAAIAVLGALVWNGWYIWAAFIMFSGWRHPPPLNNVAPLGKKRAIIGLLVLALTALLFTPAPFAL